MAARRLFEHENDAPLYLLLTLQTWTDSFEFFFKKSPKNKEIEKKIQCMYVCMRFVHIYIYIYVCVYITERAL